MRTIELLPSSNRALTIPVLLMYTAPHLGRISGILAPPRELILVVKNRLTGLPTLCCYMFGTLPMDRVNSLLKAIIYPLLSFYVYMALANMSGVEWQKQQGQPKPLSNRPLSPESQHTLHLLLLGLWFSPRSHTWGGEIRVLPFCRLVLPTSIQIVSRSSSYLLYKVSAHVQSIHPGVSGVWH